MSKLYSNILKGLSPYTPGEQLNDKSYIKLNTNENPYPPSKKVLDSIKQNTTESLRLYPDPESKQLVETLAQYHNVKNENIFVSNGSDETLAFAFAAFYADKDIMYPSITYSFYPVYSKLYACKDRQVDMGVNLSIDKGAFYTKGIGKIFANPNAPTGELLDAEYLKSILEFDKDSVVLVDEAYMDFSGQKSMAECISEYNNLLVIRTFSKSYSLAGMRVGYAVADEHLIRALNMVKNSFNSYPLDRLAQAAAQTAIQEQDYFNYNNARIISTRERISDILRSMNCTVLPSSSNFLFVSFQSYDGEYIYKQLRERAVLVRYFSAVPDYVRITIGTDEQMDILIEQLKEIFKT